MSQRTAHIPYGAYWCTPFTKWQGGVFRSARHRICGARRKGRNRAPEHRSWFDRTRHPRHDRAAAGRFLRRAVVVRHARRAACRRSDRVPGMRHQRGLSSGGWPRDCRRRRRDGAGDRRRPHLQQSARLLSRAARPGRNGGVRGLDRGEHRQRPVRRRGHAANRRERRARVMASTPASSTTSCCSARSSTPRGRRISSVAT